MLYTQLLIPKQSLNAYKRYSNSSCKINFRKKKHAWISVFCTKVDLHLNSIFHELFRVDMYYMFMPKDEQTRHQLLVLCWLVSRIGECLGDGYG